MRLPQRNLIGLTFLQNRDAPFLMSNKRRYVMRETQRRSTQRLRTLHRLVLWRKDIARVHRKVPESQTDFLGYLID